MGIPFIRQFLADLDGLQPLVDPFTSIAFLEVRFQSSLDGQLWVNGFFNALPSNLCQPQLERFRFGRGNRLDDSENLLGVGHIGQTLFAI